MINGLWLCSSTLRTAALTCDQRFAFPWSLALQCCGAGQVRGAAGAVRGCPNPGPSANFPNGHGWSVQRLAEVVVEHGCGWHAGTTLSPELVIGRSQTVSWE